MDELQYHAENIADEMGLSGYLKLQGVSPVSARKASERYIKAHLAEYYSTIRNTHLFTINVTKVYNDCGTVVIKGKEQRVKTVLDKYKPFFIIDDLGNNLKQQLSTGYLNGEYKKAVAQITSAEEQEIIAQLETTTNPDFQLYTPVNFESVKRAIQHGLVGKQHASTELTKTQIDYCERLAGKADDYLRIRTDYVQNKTGRLYATNTNLQNAPKVARRAILGSYKLLDYNSACFSVIYQIASNFKEYPTLWQYINSPEKFRLKIANDIVNQHRKSIHKERMKSKLSNTSEVYKNVKTAFTSIGFGAKTNGSIHSCWYENGKPQESAVKASLGALAPFFIEHGSVKNFIKEFNDAMELVYSAFYDEGSEEIYPGVTINRTESKSKQLATIYQSLERQLLDMLIEEIPRDKLLVLLHDGVAVTKDTEALDVKIRVQDKIKNNFKVTSSTGEQFSVIENKCFITLSIDLID